MLNDQDSSLHLGRSARTWQEEEEEERSRKFRTRVRWGTTLLVILLLIAGAWYAYPILLREGVLPAHITALPARVASVTEGLAAAGKRADDADSRMSQIVVATGERMTTLETKLGASLRAARKETGAFVNQMQQRLQAALDRRLDGLQARVTQVEAGQESDKVRMARLEVEVADVREQNARQLALMQQERDRALNRVDQQLADLGQQVEGDKRDVASVQRQVNRRRVDFEAGTNHSRELAEGITLNVSHTDISHQRFGGYVFLMPDRRTLWVHGQTVQQPLVFYSREDSRPRELVITRVTKYSVVGYLLLPEAGA
jgi:hypothetical protein